MQTRERAQLLTKYLLLALAVLTPVLALAGDAVGQTSAESSSTSPLLYTGLFGNQFVNVYQVGQASKGPISRLLDGIVGGLITGDIVVDQEQNVYVATASCCVVVYPRGGLVPQLRYNFPDFDNQGFPPIPQGLAVGQDGTLYAALSGFAVVAEYQKGNPNHASLVIPVPQDPCAPDFCNAIAVAVDGSNNVYIEYGPRGFRQPAFLEKCAPGSTQCTQLGITLGGNGAGHLAVDSQGNLIACDSSVPQVDIFSPGSIQPRVISQGLLGCPFFALNQAETRIYVANTVPNFNFNQGVAVFDYASGALVNIITAGIPAGDAIFGVAVSPAAQ